MFEWPVNFDCFLLILIHYNIIVYLELCLIELRK